MRDKGLTLERIEALDSSQRAERTGFGTWARMPAYILFFLMLFVPLAYQPVKAILLTLTLGAVALNCLSRTSVNIHWKLFLWTGLIVATGLGFMLLGAVNGTPGALRVGTVYAVWPIVYLMLVAGVTERKVVDDIVKVMILGLAAIALYSLSYVFQMVGWLPDALYIELNQGQEIGFGSGYVDVNIHSTNSLMFLIPFGIAYLLSRSEVSPLPVSRRTLSVALLLGLVFTILSGRRGLWLVVILAPFVTLAIMVVGNQFSFRKHKGAKLGYGALVGAMALGAFAILSSGFDLNLHGLYTTFTSAFDTSASPGAYLRKEQFGALLSEWSERPFFGAGHGASAAGSLRSVDFPWAYELQYLAVLFQTGLVGFMVYAASVVWIFWVGIGMIRSGHSLGAYMLPLLVGSICFLVANASNPTIGKFDHMWVIFLPLSVINIWLIENSNDEVKYAVRGASS